MAKGEDASFSSSVLPTHRSGRPYWNQRPLGPFVNTPTIKKINVIT